jgi:DNA-binding NtrC family response regulator
LAFAIEERESIILLLGESGVGKSFLAEKIHQLSSRSTKPFITIDCSPTNENLSDSEIFGHIKGSFTGAYRNRDGALETAKDGIVFIDEIHRASQVLQNKLLNFLRTRKYKKLGSDKVLSSNAKILIGTNQDPKKLVQRGEIKEDFFNRIANGRVFEIPPIRKRSEDIAAIIEWELNEYNENNKRKFSVDTSAVEKIAKFNWPGNYDQLRRYLIRKLNDCFIEKVTILTRDAIEKDPPEDKSFDNPFTQLEDILLKVIPLWNIEEEKIISNLIAPMLANIYINKMDGKRTKASRYIEISDKTLDQRLDQYKAIYEKHIKS